MQELIELYNKAIEYYSAFDNDKHLEYLSKLQELFKGDQMKEVSKEEEKKESDSKQSVDKFKEEQKNKSQVVQEPIVINQQSQETGQSANNQQKQENKDENSIQ